METPPSVETVVSKAHRSHRPESRSITVDEALQYTPLTTSVLPVHDRLPIPSIERPTHARLTTSSERKTVYRYDYQPQDIRNKLDVLLNRDSLTEIKFKQRPHGTNNLRGESEERSNLSATATMVLKMSNVDYRYPSPESPEKPQSFRQTPVQEVRQSTPQQLKRASPISNGLGKPEHDSLTIKKEPSEFPLKKGYITAPASPKRRKLSEDDNFKESVLHIRSQKESVDAALLRFQNQLLEIFEAQDRLEPDTSNVFAPRDSDIFESFREDDESEIQLSQSTHEKLLQSLKQLNTSNRLNDVSSDHIRRLQLLCEPAIEATKTINLRLNTEPSKDDQELWVRRIQRADNGIAASSTLLQTVLGSLHNDQLLCLDLLKWLPSTLSNIFETCLIPIIEPRSDNQNSELYHHASEHKDALKKLLESCRKLLELISTACVQVKGVEGLVNASEFLAIKLIFVQNPAIEKGSILGSQNFERVRKQAMSALAKIYAAFPKERSAILDEILVSLDKLPSTSRNARQYRLGDGKNIQLISALFMQLVQTAAIDSLETGQKRASLGVEKSAEANAVFDEEQDDEKMEMDEDEHTGPKDESPLTKLRRKADQLFGGAAKVAQEIIAYIVGKASKVTKTGDSPYRSVLELFLEDLVNVLPLTEWPASELLLRILSVRMIEMVRTEKAALSKTMGLEILGTMGSAISNLKVSLRTLIANAEREAETSSSTSKTYLLKLAEEHLLAGLRDSDVISTQGPFAIMVQNLKSKTGKTLHAKSTWSFFLAQYAKMVCQTLKISGDVSSEVKLDAESSKIVNDILFQFSETQSNLTMPNLGNEASTNELRLAYSLSVLNLGFCRIFGVILKTLASSLSSEQAQVRTRSLKSVVTMLEMDPSLLDRDQSIADDVFRCASDDSALVRDSALSLIAKFIVSKPSLEEKGIRRLLECAADTKIAVQKRAIGHLRDLYLTESRPQLKAAIAQTFLRRTIDHEDSVADLAKKVLTEVWISPNVALLADATDSAKGIVALEDLTSQIIESVQSNPEELLALLKQFLTWTTKNSGSNSSIDGLCSRMVGILFEATIAGSATKISLMVLMILVEVEPRSVAPQQLSNLRRYLSNIASEEDLFMFKSVIGIFRSVLPRLSSTHNTLLKDIQDDLLKSINKLARRIEMDEVMSCLRTIDNVLHNTFRLVKLTASVVTQITNPAVNDNSRVKLLRIAGSIGKYIDLEQHAQQLQNDLKTFKGGSVSGFLVDTIYPYASDEKSLSIRLLALESLGSLCQSWPEQFNKKRISGMLFAILAGQVSSTVEPEDLVKLQIVVLKNFDELYAARAAVKNQNDKSIEDAPQTQELGKLGGNTKTRDEDSAVSMITRTVVDHVLQIALSERGEKALLATQILANISHQGMIHPKQSTGAFVALETSPDQNIKEIAIAAHRLLHQQHESVCEREYMYAVKDAFRYQKLSNNAYGVEKPGFKPKLAACFEIVNTSGSKYVKKFLSNMITRINSEPSKFKDDENMVEHISFVCFVVQNLAFFEYVRMEDLLHAILQLELAFSKNGAEVAQAIETSLILDPHDNPVTSQDPNELPNIELNSQRGVDEDQLKRLTTAAAAVTLISEARSHLRRQYGISRDAKLALHQSKQAKDAAKAPLKVYGINGDQMWDKSMSILKSLDDEEAMLARCRAFVALMAIDEEVKVADEDNPRLSNSVSVEPEGHQQQSKKRKSANGSTGGTPKKPRGQSLKPSTSYNRRSTSISSKDDLDADYEL